MRNVSDKSWRENQKHFIINSIFFFENSTVPETKWKKDGGGGQATDDNLLRRMRIACWIPNAPNTHTEYVILIAFPRQRLRERASILR
jgi:hypothetical protein